ncbi:hypothetical protein BB561_000623 [Smittium simulii]|uniref:Uncharacterized protein n=1 Tax=Smittium simulii TaxID=133385 RepID=A0A2T9YY88_9FUNG|nr:hypothetical protein BB561_000623 [Smittium simulii]
MESFQKYKYQRLHLFTGRLGASNYNLPLTSEQVPMKKKNSKQNKNKPSTVSKIDMTDILEKIWCPPSSRKAYVEINNTSKTAKECIDKFISNTQASNFQDLNFKNYWEEAYLKTKYAFSSESNSSITVLESNDPENPLQDISTFENNSSVPTTLLSTKYTPESVSFESSISNSATLIETDTNFYENKIKLVSELNPDILCSDKNACKQLKINKTLLNHQNITKNSDDGKDFHHVSLQTKINFKDPASTNVVALKKRKRDSDLTNVDIAAKHPRVSHNLVSMITSKKIEKINKQFNYEDYDNTMIKVDEIVRYLESDLGAFAKLKTNVFGFID